MRDHDLRAILSHSCLIANKEKQPNCAVACMCSLFADSEFFGAAMGISESFLSLGWIVGPLLGGYTADVAGFAAPFILTGGLALLATPVLYFLMPEGTLAAPLTEMCLCTAPPAHQETVP